MYCSCDMGKLKHCQGKKTERSENFKYQVRTQILINLTFIKIILNELCGQLK